MTTPERAVYIGIRGTVLALSRSTGEELWRTDLKGADFVNLILDGDLVLATAKGEIFCLDAATGELQWHNKLSGMGWGLVSLATVNAPGKSIAPEAAKRKRDSADAAAAGSAVNT